ncbi:hypothetical protein [Nonomuraea candida]|uniref:hypothetical protein n=1 Tax=Nonomuraea candida TaxID=359159 RepID=UPI0005BBD092|nr:hypothetical protein [Nonomuraea candida]
MWVENDHRPISEPGGKSARPSVAILLMACMRVMFVPGTGSAIVPETSSRVSRRVPRLSLVQVCTMRVTVAPSGGSSAAGVSGVNPLSSDSTSPALPSVPRNPASRRIFLAGSVVRSCLKSAAALSTCGSLARIVTG